MLNRARAQIGIPLLVLVALIAATIFHYRPERAELMSLAGDVAAAEQRLTYVIDHSDELEQIAEFLPSELDDGNVGDQDFLLKMSEKLRVLDMTPKTVQPKGEKRIGDYMERGYLLELECSYTALAEFMDFLEELPELVLVEWFDMRSAEVGAGDVHTAVIRLTVVSR
jgi:hypothetical protein